MYSISLQPVKASNPLSGMSTWAFNPDEEIFQPRKKSNTYQESVQNYKAPACG